MAEPLSYDLTYEALMAQKLADIENQYNKRPGDIIYTSLAANSIEVIQMLASLTNFRDITFADTAPRAELILIAAERGIKPKEATSARWRGTFNIAIPIGSRFSLETNDYTVLEELTPLNYLLEASPKGSIGNAYQGNLVPVDDIPGLSSAQLVELLIPGQDEESTEDLRQRYRDSFEAAIFGGNRADYKNKVKGLPGVGGVKVYRAKYGAGTVGLVILDSQFKKPSQVLIDQVQETMDPIGEQGEGVGLAPIDHIVTVTGAGETTINIATTITYESGFTWADVEPQVRSLINDYFESLGEEWSSAVSKAEDDAGVVVRISQIELRLLGVTGILDVANTTLNSNQSNIQLVPENIPKLGTLQ